MPKPRVLLIEENYKKIEQIRDLLEIEGLDIEIALTLELGREILETRQMEFIIIDLGDNRQDVISLSSKIKQSGFDCPVIALMPEQYFKDFKKTRGSRIFFVDNKDEELGALIQTVRNMGVEKPA